MQILIMGLGVTGGALSRWFCEHTNHSIVGYDPGKDMLAIPRTADAIFICVPSRNIDECIEIAKCYDKPIFIRSTVVPGTCDSLREKHYFNKIFACPEFLTEKTAYQDMCKLPIVVASSSISMRSVARQIFPEKGISFVPNNCTAEMIKYTHNCFGAIKVTYFNIINDLCEKEGIDYDTVRKNILHTGFISKTHTDVPGHDGKYGYGGKCFPENIKTFADYATKHNNNLLFLVINMLNTEHREKGEL